MRRVRVEIPYSEEYLAAIDSDNELSADTRPMVYPTPYPCWCSGSSMTADFWVAFAPDEGTDEYIKRLWPEWNGEYSFNYDVPEITSSDRFPIDREIYDEKGFARQPGKTAAELAAERQTAQSQADAEMEARLNNPVTDEFGGKLYDIGSQDPKQVAEFLAALNKRSSDGLSD